MQTNSMKSAVMLGVGAAALWMALKPENRNKFSNMTEQMKNKVPWFKKRENLPIEKAGHPDPLDIEDNNMVSEGAMYGVNYYNENLQQT